MAHLGGFTGTFRKDTVKPENVDVGK